MFSRDKLLNKLQIDINFSYKLFYKLNLINIHLILHTPKKHDGKTRSINNLNFFSHYLVVPPSWFWTPCNLPLKVQGDTGAKVWSLRPSIALTHPRQNVNVFLKILNLRRILTQLLICTWTRRNRSSIQKSWDGIGTRVGTFHQFQSSLM